MPGNRALQTRPPAGSGRSGGRRQSARPRVAAAQGQAGGGRQSVAVRETAREQGIFADGKRLENGGRRGRTRGTEENQSTGDAVPMGGLVLNLTTTGGD